MQGVVEYVVAVPSYKRADVIYKKTLKTLREGNVPSHCIHIFVANQAEADEYSAKVPKDLYGRIVVGELGIANQRRFISTYFDEGQYIVSIDDDVEALLELPRGAKSETKLVRKRDLNRFFIEAYRKLKQEKLFIWGVYPVRNPFFMKRNITTDLRFIIGVLFGYINRPSLLSKLAPSSKAESKEDYEQSILYYQHDGGVVRYNYIVPKTKFNAEGGLGKDRFQRNLKAAEYLEKKYPTIIVRFTRKNGTPEVKFTRTQKRRKR